MVNSNNERSSQSTSGVKLRPQASTRPRPPWRAVVGHVHGRVLQDRRQRQQQPEARPAAIKARLDLDPPVVCVHDLTNDGQAQARTRAAWS